MRLSSKGYIFLLCLLVGCDASIINGGYHDLGLFGTRIEAQNHAVADILKNYGSLPNGYYKVSYSFRNPTPTAPTGQNSHAIWYNKSETQLALESDIGSGVSCRWADVTRTVLAQANKATDSMGKIDSLAKPNQPIAQCQ